MNMMDAAEDRDAGIAIEDGYGGAESWIERRLVDARDAIREEPIKTVLIAAAVGAILGRIVLR